MSVTEDQALELALGAIAEVLDPAVRIPVLVGDLRTILQELKRLREIEFRMKGLDK